MSRTLYRRLPIPAIFAYALFSALVGCSSRAHSDLYRQKMAGEIRVLEDQLYEADYHNRVLHDELERARIEAARIDVRPAKKPESAPEQVPRPAPKKDAPSRPRDEMGSGLETPEETFDPNELDLPMFDEGEPVDPDALTDPTLPNLPSEADPSTVDGDSPDALLPAPGGPEPPGKSDLEIPPVLPGEILPPPAADGDELKPPGQIKLPDSVQKIERVPDTLRIHKGLSGGQRVDGQIDGITIVVNVVDQIGTTIDLKGFDVDAELSIVILDPNLDPAEARLGRWDFSSQQVIDLVKSQPISGLHVPVQWQEAEPSGDEVIVHVRLRSEEDEMRCEERLKVERKAAVAQWTPRGESLQ